MRREYFGLALQSLRRRKVRSYLTLIGVIIGIAAVVSLIGIGQGLRNFVTGQFSTFDTDVLSINADGTGNGPPGAGVVNPLTEKQLQAVRRVKGVESAYGRFIEFGGVEYNDKLYYGYFFTVPEGAYRAVSYDVSNYEIEEGRLLKDGDTDRIVVGHDYLDKERFGKQIAVGTRMLVNGTPYTVVGVLKKKGSFITDNTILMNDPTMRTAFGKAKDTYGIFAVRMDKGVIVKDVKADIEKVLRKERNVKVGEEDFSVQTAEQALKNLSDVLFAVQLFITIIASVSLVVGGIGIMNTMFTAVLERTKDIGIMKAIGARNSDIFFIFAIESGMIGLVGGAIGLAIGAGLAYGLAFAASAALGQDISASVSLLLAIGSLLFSFVIGTIAGLLPAYRAARLEPVDALREGA